MLRKASTTHYGNTTSRILIIYTGGTIGMVNYPSLGAYAPLKGYLKEKVKSFCPLYDPDYVYQPEDLLTDHEPFATPISMYNRRIIYGIEELDPILDSANMSMTDWAKIASIIETFYEMYDGFVVVHGTDTMAYSASALSFMLENLGKTVILTGSLIPLSEQRNDAVNNLLGALIFASHYVIPEVAIYFNNKLLRGNRSIKTNSGDIDAFQSPNMSPLANMGTHITVNWRHVRDSMGLAKFRVQKEMSLDVAILRLFPGMTSNVLRQFLAPPIKGAVLLSYGAGNGPDARKDLLDVFREVCERGVIVVNVTQCLTGTVSAEYNTGKHDDEVRQLDAMYRLNNNSQKMVLSDIGIVAGGDMTAEAALTKLSYVIAKTEMDVGEKRKIMTSNLRGEITPVATKNLSSLFLDSTSYLSKASYHRDEYNRHDTSRFLRKSISALEQSSQKEMCALREAVLPTIMCNAAALGNLPKLEEAVEQAVSVNHPDYDGRTPLHLAASEGRLEIVEYLLKKGAIVHTRDRFGNTPFVDAIKNKYKDIVTLMIDGGAHLQYSAAQVTDAICLSVLENDTQQIEMWHLVKTDLNALGTNGFNSLHMSVLSNHKSCYVKLRELGADPTVTDTNGVSALEMIESLKRPNFELNLVSFLDHPESENGLCSGGCIPPQEEEEDNGQVPAKPSLTSEEIHLCITAEPAPAGEVETI